MGVERTRAVECSAVKRGTVVEEGPLCPSSIGSDLSALLSRRGERGALSPLVVLEDGHCGRSLSHPPAPPLRVSVAS